MSKPRTYGVSQDTQSEGLDLKLFQPGINEGVVLEKVAYELASSKENADPNGLKALVFTFKGQDGESYRHIEFEINPDNAKKGAEKLYDTLVQNGQTPKETKAEYVENQIEKAYESLEKRVKHVMTKFMDEAEAIIPPVATFEQYANMVAKMINKANDSRKLRTIMVYDKSGYLKFPTFVPFLEVMVDGVNSELAGKLNPKYHRLVKPDASNYPNQGKPSKPVAADVEDF